jgi:hypothetical protein
MLWDVRKYSPRSGLVQPEGGGNDEERGRVAVPIGHSCRAPRHASPLSFDVKRKSQIKVGDRVTVMKVSPDSSAGEGMDTPAVFRRAVGRTFRVEGIDEYGHLELVVAERRPTPDKYESDTIWIEPEFVVLAQGQHAKK